MGATMPQGSVWCISFQTPLSVSSHPYKCTLGKDTVYPVIWAILQHSLRESSLCQEVSLCFLFAKAAGRSWFGHPKVEFVSAPRGDFSGGSFCCD